MKMQDWLFWAMAGAMALAVLAVLVQAMRAAGATAEAPGHADLRVYRDQLAEIDRDVARGTLPAEEAARLRTDVARRVLEADRQAQAQGPVGRSGFGLAAIVVVGLVAGAVAVYARLGVPGYPDLPLAQRIALSDAAYLERPDQEAAEAAAPVRKPVPVSADFTELMDKLRSAMAERPEDVQGLELLARNEAALGNFAEARRAQAALVVAKGTKAGAEDHAALAEISIVAAGGLVTAEAEAALIAALQADATNGTARYYTGLMFAQIGRPDRTFAMWRPLLDEGPEDAPWIGPIRAQIGEVAAAAGIRYALPLPVGPDAGQIAAAAEMSPEDRQAMIAGMVEQLSDRLATEGGPAGDWARLISSLVVLGEMDRAEQIFREAEGKFPAGSPDAALIRNAAVEAGLVR